MAAGKLLNLIALTALALLASSLGPAPVNALSTNHIQHARHVAHAQEVATKRKRDTSKRCKPRPSSQAPAPSSAAPAKAAPSPSAPAPAPSSHAAAPSQPPKAPEPSKAAPPKTTAAPPPPPVSGGGGGISTQGGKLGLAWPNGGDVNVLKNFITPRVHSMYTWSPFCPDNTLGIKCLPMMWGDKDASKMPALTAQPATDKNNLILFINEPNEPGQANMTPQHACDLYYQYLKPKEALGYEFITPATSSNPNGLQWVKDFKNCCKDCKFIGTAIHWYDTTLQKFQDYVNLWHTTFGLPIYVTEYALQNFNGGAQPSSDQVIAFHKAAAAWMDQQNFIITYMPFGFMNDMSGVNEANRLMNGNVPTALGTALLTGAY